MAPEPQCDATRLWRSVDDDLTIVFSTLDLLKEAYLTDTEYAQLQTAIQASNRITQSLRRIPK